MSQVAPTYRPLLKTLPAIVLLGLCLSVQTTFPQSALESKYAGKISQWRLLSTVRDLAKIGARMGGTKSGDRAATYVAKKFKEAGLTVEVMEDPERLTFTNKKWSVRIDEPKSLRKLIRNEWLGGFSPSVPPSRVSLTTLGDESELEEEELRGKAVLLNWSISTRLYQKLADAGAVAILAISPKLPNAYSDWALIGDLKTSDDNPLPLFNLSYNNGIRLKQALADSVPVVVSFSTQTVIAQGRPKTVVATLEGADKAYFIVCAHGDSDSGGPGADDNASGVSGILELARAMNGMVNSKIVAKPKKSIRFIVWGSEIYSTQQYIKRHENELPLILGVLNFDEIGTGAERNCLYFESNDVEHNEKLLRVLQRVGEDYVGMRGFWAEATTNPSQGGTDSYVFLPHGLRQLNVPVVKIPSVTIFTGAWNELKTIGQTEGWTSKAWKGHPDSVVIDYSHYYHSSLDIPELTTEKEPFNMVWAAKAVGIALLRLAW